MIHQLIFANPKPGWTAARFLDYWLNVHAVRYASKIRQIVLYKIDEPVPAPAPLPGHPLPFAGVAEIWLESEQQQLASLQSPEFISGARQDEPNWAAFWETLGLDTDPHMITAGAPAANPVQGVKLLTLWKRKPGMELGEFRAHTLGEYARRLTNLPGQRRLLIGHVRDSFYAVGEARFDAVTQAWFDDTSALRSALESSAMRESVRPDEANFADPKYTFSVALKENWIIGPQPRA